MRAVDDTLDLPASMTAEERAARLRPLTPEEREARRAARGRRAVTDEERDEMRELRRLGATLPEIVAATGWSIGAVQRAVVGVRPDLDLPRLREDQILAIYNAPETTSAKTVASVVGCYRSTVLYWRKRKPAARVARMQNRRPNPRSVPGGGA